MQKTQDERGKLIVKLREEGKTFQQIADILNITRQRVQQIYKELSHSKN